MTASLRKVVPAGYVEATLLLEGTAPLLMNSGEYDPDGELYRAYWTLGQKRRKSLDDNARLRELEWKLRIYLDGELGPYIPAINIEEMLRKAGTKWRLGEEIKRSLVVIDGRLPLQYDGPRDEKGLWAAGFRYTRMVANNGIGSGRVMRCRPMFNLPWAVEAPLAYDPEDLDYDMLELVAERSQKYGLGDYRPMFGSFRATLIRDGGSDRSTNGSATKSRAAGEIGRRAAVERIKA